MKTIPTLWNLILICLYILQEMLEDRFVYGSSTRMKIEHLIIGRLKWVIHVKLTPKKRLSRKLPSIHMATNFIARTWKETSLISDLIHKNPEEYPYIAWREAKKISWVILISFVVTQCLLWLPWNPSIYGFTILFSKAKEDLYSNLH